ncbi:YpmS family protein [Halalkalibacter kiskunsagensis]|uniref:YpmS family protein n=1 Tax=Halalkalibacter kiskunsagensis TaxID=1548599 RepID=A0ABV6KK49_9BACI
MKKNNHVWKIAFFALSGLVVLVIIILFMLIQRYFPEVDENHFVQKQPTTEEAAFVIQTNKARLNTLIASRIEQTPSDISYMVELLEENVQFRSAFKILGQEVPVTINFNPVVVPNGDLLLEVETFSVGILSLPVDQVLQFISNWIEVADWIVTYPSERVVEVKVTDIKVDENESMRFRFLTFDLEQDNIELEMIID